MTRTALARFVSLLGGLVLATAAPAFGQSDPHTAHGQEQNQPSPPAKPSPAGTHEHPAVKEQSPDLPPFVPPITDEDRKAAFSDVQGHGVHDNVISYFVLFDQLEWQAGEGMSGINIDSRGWVGRDRDRLWFRAEGDGDDGRVDEAQAHILYGRQFSRWWDVVAGVRQDFRPGNAQTWAAFGLQGLAPHWFEIEATGYIGASGRTHVRFKVEYELLVTNRLVLQPLVETEIVGKSDPERGVGAGLSTTEVGLRLRYEIRREVAPYIGITWNRKWGKTADFAEAEGEDTGGARFAMGLRFWF